MTHNEITKMQAGPEIDALLRKMCGKNEYRKPRHGTCCTCQNCGWPHDECDCDWSPSTDIAAAMEEVLPQLIKNAGGNAYWQITSTHYADGREDEVGFIFNNISTPGWHDPIELQICKVALLTTLEPAKGKL